jgi:WD40 repeat protein
LVVGEIDFLSDRKGRTSLRDLATGRRFKMIDGQRLLALAPDGRTLATGSLDNTVRLLACVTLQERAAAGGHTEVISAGAFSPDGSSWRPPA